MIIVLFLALKRSLRCWFIEFMKEFKVVVQVHFTCHFSVLRLENCLLLSTLSWWTRSGFESHYLLCVYNGKWVDTEPENTRYCRQPRLMLVAVFLETLETSGRLKVIAVVYLSIGHLGQGQNYTQCIYSEWLSFKIYESNQFGYKIQSLFINHVSVVSLRTLFGGG